MTDFVMENENKNKSIPINIIGFSGKIGVGKNYICENIIGKQLYELGYQIHFIGFGDFVKYEVGSRLEKTTCVDTNFITKMNEVYEGLFINKKKEIRRILQIYATEISRNGSDIVLDTENDIVLHNEPNIWVKSAHLNIMNIISKSYNPLKDIFIITDIRFLNEIEYIKMNGGLLVRINADKRNHHKLVEEAYKSNKDISSSELESFLSKAKLHVSETSLDSDCDSNFDVIIQNDYEDVDTVNEQINDCICRIISYINKKI